jgi:hypothetical protein
MANLLIANLFSKNQDGKDSDVRQFRSAITDTVKVQGSKVSSFSIDNGIITMTVDDETIAKKLQEDLQHLDGVNVTVVGSALEAFIGRHNSQKTATK